MNVEECLAKLNFSTAFRGVRCTPSVLIFTNPKQFDISPSSRDVNFFSTDVTEDVGSKLQLLQKEKVSSDRGLTSPFVEVK